MLKRTQMSPIAATLLLLSSQAHAVSSGELSLGAQQFATESAPGSRADLKADLRSESVLSYGGVETGIPVRQADFFLLYESGSNGEHGFDVDNLVQRWGLGSGHLWLGRVHPGAEGRTDSVVSSTSAIGASWAQNQGDALAPRVSGWIGTGLHLRSANGMFATLAYSPLFLPSFGPRVTYSDTATAQGSRFGRLPPQTVQIGGANPLPLYYRIDAGDVLKIVRQDQAWFSLGKEFESLRVEALAWTAPSPNPSVSTSALVQSGVSGADVLVTVSPSFVRETFAGGAVESTKASLPARLEALNETGTGRWVVSARVSPLRPLELGWLNTFERETGVAAAAPAGASVSSPVYAKNLWWLGLSSPENWKLRPSLRVEQQPGQGGWVRPGFTWAADKHTQVFAQASVITGLDKTWFGTWRSLDSVSMGARILW